jgi:ligand-binding sensor domain-containing protein
MTGLHPAIILLVWNFSKQDSNFKTMSIVRLRPLVLLFICCFSCYYSGAQLLSRENFKEYTVLDGLTYNSVTGIAQDSYGYIWVGTNKGLNRFDGTNFKHFFSDSRDTSLPTDFVFGLRWIDKENLGVLTVFGLHIINTRTLAQRNLLIPDAPQPVSNLNRISDILSDQYGNLFLSTIGGFYEFNKKNELIFRYDYPLQSNKKGSFGWNIARADENSILISTFTGEPYIFYVKEKQIHAIGKNEKPFYQTLLKKTGTFVPVTMLDGSHLQLFSTKDSLWLYDFAHVSRKLIEVPAGFSEVFEGGWNIVGLQVNDSTILMNTFENGVYQIHSDKRSGTYSIPDEPLLRSVATSAMLLDRGGQLWIGTNKGLFARNSRAVKVDQVTLKGQEMENSVLSFSMNNNSVFAGTSRSGLIEISKKEFEEKKRIDFSQYHLHDLPNMIYAQLQLNSDTLLLGIVGLWMHTSNYTTGPLPITNTDSSFDGVELMFRDSRGILYIKNATGNLFFIRKPGEETKKTDFEKSLAQNGRITGIMEDRQGNLWFSGAGLIRYNTRSEKFDLRVDSFPKSKINSKSVTSNVVADDMGRIYFGVWERGLMQYDPHTGNCKNFTRSEGLGDNTIRALCLIKGKIWMATDNGLSFMDIANGRISNFGSADGIPNNPNGVYCLQYDSAAHKLYGAFRNVVYRFNPDSLVKNHSPPQFNIENVNVSGQENIWHPESEVVVRYDQNNMVVNLASVNFQDAFQQKFAYRIVDNGDEPWIETGSQHSIIFSNLPTGHQRIQVKVYANDGSWPEQVRELKIYVKPPFWRTAWFLVISILGVACLLYFLHLRRVRSIRQRATLDHLVAQSEMKALHSQMNPHFIFNCLNSIREMILENNNKQASHYLSKFAHLIRVTLNNSTKTFISLQSAIDYLERYLEMEQIRTSEFSYSFYVDEDIDPARIFLPPMLIQPFIENAIWHGRIPGKAMTISVRFEKQDDELVCIVDDDGLGINASLQNNTLINKESMGIDNIRKRIDLLNEKYRMNSSMDVEDKSTRPGEHGTVVTIHLPLKYNEA